jgi:hypothetical protein
MGINVYLFIYFKCEIMFLSKQKKVWDNVLDNVMDIVVWFKDKIPNLFNQIKS